MGQIKPWCLLTYYAHLHQRGT